MNMLQIAKRMEKGIIQGICAPLHHRKLILVEGYGGENFLNGLTTNQIIRSRDTDSVSTAFLNTRGRMIADALVYYRPKDTLIEVDAANSERFVDHLYKKMLREKCMIDQEMSDIFDVFAIVGADIESRDRILRNLMNNDEYGNTMILYVDPRWEMMIRVYMPKGHVPPVGNADVHFEQTPRAYEYFRKLHGVYEGPAELIPDKAFPLEVNMHFMNGVSFDKGCYLGQELVARTFHTGELRKHLFTLRKLYPYKEDRSIIAADPDRTVPIGYTQNIAEIETAGEGLVGQNVYSDSAKRTGKVLSATNDLIVSMVRLEHLDEKNEFRVGSASAEDQWQVIMPHWWEVYWGKEEGDIVDENDLVEEE